MEKSGLLKLTQSEIDEFSSTNVVPQSVNERWGFTTAEDLSAVLASGRYEVI